MLEVIRRGVKSWVVQVLLGLLVASFAVWGIGDVSRGFSTKVASVGERDIDANLFATILQREQQRLGLDPSQIRMVGLDRFVLAQLVREAAVEETARRLGLSAPDSAVARQVRSDPNFQIGGQFDATQYANAVRRVFPSIAAYEETIRRSIATQQIVTGAIGAIAAPPGAAEVLARFREERRRFDALILRTPAEPVGEPSEADLAAHLDANPGAFTEPERRAVVWLHVDPEVLAQDIDIPEDDLREAYDAQVAMLAQPERRTVDQIVFAEEADAQAARARLDDGLAFDALLAERGLSRQSATLGSVTANELRGARGEAAFALAEPGVAGPVAAAGGFALLEVREIVPGFTIPFETIAEALRLDLARQRAEPDADRLAEAVEDLRAGGATLEEVAADLGLTLFRDGGVARNGTGGDGPLSGLVAATPFLDEAFAAREGEERRIRPAPDGGYFVLRVDAVRPPSVPALDAIRDRVAEGWRAEATRAALRAEAEALKADLDAGADLATLAEARGLTVTSIGPLRRSDPDPRLGPEAREALFAAEPGTAALSAAGGGAALVVLREVVPVEPQGDVVRQFEQALAQSFGQDLFDYLGKALEDRAGVSVNTSVLDSVVSQIGG